MSSIFIFHGTDDSPNSQWFPWLTGELKKMGHDVVIPHFSGIEHESFDDWDTTFKQYEHIIAQDSIFIGHSLGCCFILKLLSEKNYNIKQSILVGAWGEKFSEEVVKMQYEKFRQLGALFPFEWMYHYESFIESLNFENIKKNCSIRTIINSKNDPYIPQELGENLAKNIDAELILYSHAGHFCKRDGYSEFWDLLDKIA